MEMTVLQIRQIAGAKVKTIFKLKANQGDA